MFKNINVEDFSSESSLYTPFGFTPKLADLISRAIFTCCVSSTHVDVEKDLYEEPSRISNDRLSMVAHEVMKMAELGYAYANQDRDDANLIDPASYPTLEWARLGKETHPETGPNSAQISIICALLHLDLAMEDAKNTGVSLASLEALAATTIALYEAAFEAARDPLCDLAIERKARSTQAKRAAVARHAEDYQNEMEVWRWCDENRHKYSSMDSAAQAAIRVIPAVPRTVRKYVGSWHKNKQSAG